MKILFILELYYPNIGGIEKLFKSLSEELVTKGHEVTVITTRFKKDLLLEEVIYGVKVKRLRISSRFVFTFFGIFSMLREARACDIIHTTSFNAAFPARISGWIARKKVIITFHEAWGKLWFKLPFTNLVSKTLYYLYEQMILKIGFHKYIAVSDYTAECLIRQGVRENKVERIYNGLDYANYDHSLYSPPPNFTFTYFGRLGISKGLDIILDTLPSYLDKYPDAHCKIIIPKTPSGFFRKIIRRLEGIPDQRYTMLHHLKDEQLRLELQQSSCVMIPSYSEGFCFAAAECIALGVPVISSDKGALKEVISGKYILMDSLDATGLENALVKARNNEWTNTDMKNFHFEETVSNYLGLYKNL